MRFVFRRDHSMVVFTLALLFGSFLILGITFHPAEAATPTVSNTGDNQSNNSLTTTVTLTTTSGNTVAVLAQNENTGTSGVLYTITGVTSPGVGGGFTEKLSVNAQCTSSAGFCNGMAGAPEWMFADAWVGVATSSGGITITVTGSSASSNTIGAQAYDISNASPTPAFLASGGCNAVSGNDCGNPIISSTPANPQVASVYLTGAATIGAGLSSSPPVFWTYVGTGNGQKTGGGFAQNSLVPPTSFPINLNGGSGLNTGYALIGLTFSSQFVSTLTTTVNTNCLGGCSGGNNGSLTYLPPPTTTFFNLHFYSSQNVQSPPGFSGQINNVTLKVAAVHITTPTGILYVCAWTTTGVPTGGNPYQLISCTSVILTNGTSNFFVHVNPQINIPSQAYYAVGVMTTTTASRGSGASLSGVAIYETGQAGLTEYKYAVGSATPPNNFFSNTPQTPHDFIYIQMFYVVNLVTTTVTQTLTGLVTSTTTTTSTSTLVVNQGDPTKPTFWYLPMFFILFFSAIFLGAYAMVNAATRGRLR